MVYATLYVSLIMGLYLELYFAELIVTFNIQIWEANAKIIAGMVEGLDMGAKEVVSHLVILISLQASDVKYGA
jgi:hypothetical protein